MNTRINIPAATAYSQSSARIQELLKRLEKGLQTHAEKAFKDPKNWGYSGDLKHIECKLAELVESFGI